MAFTSVVKSGFPQEGNVSPIRVTHPSSPPTSSEGGFDRSENGSANMMLAPTSGALIGPIIINFIHFVWPLE